MYPTITYWRSVGTIQGTVPTSAAATGCGRRQAIGSVLASAMTTPSGREVIGNASTWNNAMAARTPATTASTRRGWAASAARMRCTRVIGVRRP